MIPHNIINVVIKSLMLERGYFFDFIFFIFSFVLIYAVFNRNKTDSFLRRNLLTVFVILVAGCCFGIMAEVRIFYPALPILIPLAFYPQYAMENK